MPPSSRYARPRCTARKAAPQRRRLFLEPLESRQLLAAFAPGNLVAYRVGPAAAALASTANAVFLDEFDSAGNIVQSIAMPTAASGNQRALTASRSGVAVTEGQLTRSADGQYLLLTGYDAAIGTASVATSISSTVSRVVGRVDAAGSVDTSTGLGDFSGGNIRSAVSADGQNIYVTGSTDGVRLATFGQSPATATTQISSTITSARALEISSGQLYVSANSLGVKVATVGNSLPTTSGQAIANLPGTAISSLGEPYQFFLADLSPAVPGDDTLYVAIDSVGLRKFSLSGGNWVANGTFVPTSVGARGLAGKIVGDTVTIFVSDTQNSGQHFSGNGLWRLVDTTGHNGTPGAGAFTSFRSGITNATFRGLAMAPEATLSPTPVVIAGNGANNIVIRKSGENLEVVVDGNMLLTRELTSLTSLTINGEDGEDTLTVDHAVGGAFNLPIIFNGGNPGTLPGDALKLIGSGQNATYSPSATNGNGTITVAGGGTITFTGLEPVDMTGFGTVTLPLPGGADLVTVANGFDSLTGLIPALVLSGTSGGGPFETLHAWNNTNLVIDTTTVEAADTITISSANNNHLNQNISIITGASAGDVVNLNGSVNTDGNFTLSGVESVVLGASVTIDTEQGNNSNAGSVNFGGAAVSANAAGRDLTINADVAAAGLMGGSVTLGVFSSSAPGTNFVNDLTISTDGPGGDGILELTGNVFLNESGADLADFIYIGGGRVAVTTTLSVDVEQGNNANGGTINWGTSNVFATALGVALTLDSGSSLGGATGGNINAGAIDSGSGQFLSSLTVATTAVTSGEFQITGDILVDGPINLARRVVAMQSLTIDSEQGGNGSGGTITLGGTLYARGGSNRDITINSSTPLAGANGGNVVTGDAGIGLNLGAGASAPNDVTIITAAGAGGTAGSVTLRQDVQLNNDGAGDAGDFTIQGNGNVILSKTGTLLIDTEGGNDANPGGNVNFNLSAVSATGGADRDLSINTQGSSIAGGVTLAAFNNAGGNFVNDVSINMGGTTPGLLTLQGSILLDNNGTGDPARLIIFSGNVVITTSLTIDTEQGDTGGVTGLFPGVNFGVSRVSASAAGLNLAINTSNTGAGSIAGTIELGAFNAAGGASINNLTLTADGPGTQAGDVTLILAIGLDGSFNIAEADNIDAAQDISTVGPVNWLARQTVLLRPGVSVNAGASTISIQANQDGLGTEGFVMSSIATLTTANDSPAAIAIAVNTAGGGTGNAALAALSAGTTAGPAGGRITVAANGGSITDANAAANLTAGNAALTAAAGIGSGDAIETAVSTLAAANGPTGGNIEIANSVAGLLTIGTVAPTVGVTNTAAGGSVIISNASPLVVAANVTAAGPVSLSAGDTAAAGDDLTVNAGITVQSTGSSVTLNAGDNASIGAGALLAALTTVTINVDFGNADAGVGGIANVPATADIDAASATFNGDTDADTFNIAPDDDTPITVNGNDPVVAPGDVLNLDISGLTNPNLTVNGTNDGQWTFGNAASVTYTSIETVNATPALTCFGLTVQMNGPIGAANLGAADTTRVRVVGGNLVVAVDGIAMPVFTGSLGEIDNLTVLGSGDIDNLIIEEAPGGLPNFCDDIVGPGDGPGGPPTAGHTSETFKELTGYGDTVTFPAIDVHFNGGGGSDQLDFALTTAHSLVYTSDGLDTGASGNVGIGSGASLESFGTRQLGVSFEDITNLALQGGPGSSLFVDATESPTTGLASDLTSLTVSAGTNPADGVTEIFPNAGNTSFVQTVLMQSITALMVRAGGGADTVDLASLDTSGALFTQVLLDGDGLTGDDAADTVRVQSTSGLVIPVSLLAGEGDDIFEVRKTTPPETIDGIAGPVFVSPIGGFFADEGLGNDSLFVSDTGDLTGDNVSIRETTIEGLTGFAGTPDVDYVNIDTLDVTGTSGNDVFDTVLNSGGDLDIVRVNGSDGNDQFYLDLNTGDDLTNIVTGLVSVTLSGDGGSDVFGQTPDNAPHAVTGLPALPLPPAALEMPHFTPPAFPGVNRFKLRPSQSTAINVNGGPDNSPTAIAPTFNATQGNVFGPTFDLINLDMTDRRPAAQSDDSIVIVSTVSGFASTSDPDPGETFVPINFTTIEAINLCDQEYLTRVQMGDLYVRTTEFNDVVQFQRLSTPNLLRVRVNTQFFSLLATRKTVAYGRAGYDVIQQVNVTLPAEFHGQAGDDYLAGYTGADLIAGGAGKDRIIGHEGPNELWGDNYPQEGVPFEGPGDDFDQISGGGSADNIYGQGGGDVLNAGGGDDYVAGGSGHDNLSGSFGNDRLYGNDGNDTLSGDDGDDLLSGGSGLDTLYGRSGNNVIIGGTGADNIAGGPGNDLLYDGIVTNGTFSDNSLMQGDGHDLLMQALLADWALNSMLDEPANLALLHPHDGDADTLTGDAGFDWVSPGPEDSGDIWNFLF